MCAKIIIVIALSSGGTLQDVCVQPIHGHKVLRKAKAGRQIARFQTWRWEAWLGDPWNALGLPVPCCRCRSLWPKGQRPTLILPTLSRDRKNQFLMCGFSHSARKVAVFPPETHCQPILAPRRATASLLTWRGRQGPGGGGLRGRGVYVQCGRRPWWAILPGRSIRHQRRLFGILCSFVQSHSHQGKRLWNVHGALISRAAVLRTAAGRVTGEPGQGYAELSRPPGPKPAPHISHLGTASYLILLSAEAPGLWLVAKVLGLLES